jgi:deaminated glutathione amidase
MMIKIAALQLTTTDDFASNLVTLEKYITLAAQNGAKHIFTPENSDIMLPYHVSKNYDYNQSSVGVIDCISRLSHSLKIHIHIGSIKVPLNNGKCYNQSLVFDTYGRIVAQYNKIHLFDAIVGDGVHYYESENIQAGNKAVSYHADNLKIGYTICYDLRFGYLYHILSDNDVDLIAVPAAFTIPTGQAHWEVLLRSRAIENCCYIVAAAQCGVHSEHRHTYGHSMIIDPWGTIMVSADSDSQMIIYADINKKQRDKIKKQLNIVMHRVSNIE